MYISNFLVNIFIEKSPWNKEIYCEGGGGIKLKNDQYVDMILFFF